MTWLELLYPYRNQWLESALPVACTGQTFAAQIASGRSGQVKRNAKPIDDPLFRQGNLSPRPMQYNALCDSRRTTRMRHRIRLLEQKHKSDLVPTSGLCVARVEPTVLDARLHDGLTPRPDVTTVQDSNWTGRSRSTQHWDLALTSDLSTIPFGQELVSGGSGLGCSTCALLSRHHRTAMIQINASSNATSATLAGTTHSRFETFQIDGLGR